MVTNNIEDRDGITNQKKLKVDTSSIGDFPEPEHTGAKQVSNPTPNTDINKTWFNQNVNPNVQAPKNTGDIGDFPEPEHIGATQVDKPTPNADINKTWFNQDFNPNVQAPTNQYDATPSPTPSVSVNKPQTSSNTQDRYITKKKDNLLYWSDGTIEEVTIDSHTGGEAVLSDGTTVYASEVSGFNQTQFDEDGNRIPNIQQLPQSVSEPSYTQNKQAEEPEEKQNQGTTEETPVATTFSEWAKNGKNMVELLDVVEEKYGIEASYDNTTGELVGRRDGQVVSRWSFDNNGMPVVTESEVFDVKSFTNEMASSANPQEFVTNYMVNNEGLARDNYEDIKKAYLSTQKDKKILDTVSSFDMYTAEDLHNAYLEGDIVLGSETYEALSNEQKKALSSYSNRTLANHILSGEQIVPDVLSVTSPDDVYRGLDKHTPSYEEGYNKIIKGNSTLTMLAGDLSDTHREIQSIQAELELAEDNIRIENPQASESEIAQEIRIHNNALTTKLRRLQASYNSSANEYNREYTLADGQYQAYKFDEDYEAQVWEASVQQYLGNVSQKQLEYENEQNRLQEVEITRMNTIQKDIENARDNATKLALEEQKQIHEAKLQELKGDQAINEVVAKHIGVMEKLDFETKSRAIAESLQRQHDKTLIDYNSKVKKGEGKWLERDDGLYYASNDGGIARKVSHQGSASNGTYTRINTNKDGTKEIVVYDIKGNSSRLTAENTGLTTKGVNLLNASDGTRIPTRLSQVSPGNPGGKECGEYVNDIFNRDPQYSMGNSLGEKLRVANEKVGALGSIIVTSTGAQYGHVGIVVGESEDKTKWYVKSSNAGQKGLISTISIDKGSKKIKGYKSTDIFKNIYTGTETEELTPAEQKSQDMRRVAVEVLKGNADTSSLIHTDSSNIEIAISSSGLRSELDWLPNTQYYELKQADKKEFNELFVARDKLAVLGELVNDVSTGMIQTPVTRYVNIIKAAGGSISADEDLQDLHELELRAKTQFGEFIYSLSGAAASDAERDFYKKLALNVSTGDQTMRAGFNAISKKFTGDLNSKAAIYFSKPNDPKFEYNNIYTYNYKQDDDMYGEIDEADAIYNPLYINRMEKAILHRNIPAEDIALIEERLLGVTIAPDNTPERQAQDAMSGMLNAQSAHDLFDKQ